LGVSFFKASRELVSAEMSRADLCGDFMKKYKQPLEKRLHVRKAVADWRKANPEKAKQHYRNWIMKKRGIDYKPRKSGAYYGAFDKNFNPKVKKKYGGS